MISLNYRDSRPIYEQIKEALKKQIMDGAYKKDEKLPSVRELAAELAINPNTISKAIKELENEGYIYTVQGKGAFAAEFSEVDRGRANKVLKTFDESVKELLFLGETVESLADRIRHLEKEREGV